MYLHVDCGMFGLKWLCLPCYKAYYSAREIIEKGEPPCGCNECGVNG
jgi:hypothetical protein